MHLSERALLKKSKSRNRLEKPFLQVSRDPSGAVRVMLRFQSPGFTLVLNSRLRGSVSCYFGKGEPLLTLED